VRQTAIALLVLGAISLVPREQAMPSTSNAPQFLYTVAKRYEPLAWMKGGDRFPSGAKLFTRDRNGERALASDFAASADAAVSFDGKRVLFAGKRAAQDHWQIWEITLAGGDPRAITSCAGHCVRPFYLPDDRIVYAENVGGRFVIQNLSVAEGKSFALTYLPSNSFPTDVLRDGRVLFESVYGAGRTPDIYTVYSDGSGVESYRCDHGPARHSGRQVSSGDIVFADNHGLARFTSALAKPARIGAPSGDYAAGPEETATGEWLLAWRPRANKNFRLMWWTPGQTAMRNAMEEQADDVIQPVLIRENFVPKKHPSGLHDWQFANLLCLNAYTSKDKFAAGSIRSVRVYTLESAGVPQLLGNAPVESDGSFYIQVPGDQPLQVELLDASGKTLKRETGWFWSRKGEQRVCVGCHAGPETAPENIVPMALQKSTTPADLTHASTAVGGHE